MRRDTRKQPWQTFPFWFLILSGMALTAAWQLDLLRPQATPVTIAEEATLDEVAPDWANSVAGDESVSAIDEQSEPLIEEQSARSFPNESESGITSAPEQHEPLDGGMPSEASTAIEAPKSPATANPFSRTDARLVSAQRERTPSAAFAPSQSLAEIAAPPKSSASKSPFGPARVEFQGTRPRNAASQPAENAARPTEPAASRTPPDPVKQTASIGADEAFEPVDAKPPTPRLAITSQPKIPSTETTEPVDFSAIDQLILDGEDVEANFQLSSLYWKRPEIRDQLLKRLSVVAYRIYFAPQPHYMDGHVVQAGDQLQNIAKDYDVSWEYLAKLNRTDAKKIRPGQKLKVIRGPFAGVVDLSDREMTIHSHGHFVARFEVGIGKDNPSPIGTHKVIEKRRDPIYYGPEGVVAHDDPQNPLGECWLDLGDNYGIHGTIDDASISQAESQGCIRMKNRDIADVYDLLTPGSEVLIRR